MHLLSSVSKREKGLLAITISLIALCIAYTFLIEPLYRQYVDLNQEIRLKQARLAKNLRLLQEKDAIKQEFRNYNHQFKPQGTEEEEMALVLAEIEKIGKATGIYLSDVKPQKIKSYDFYKMIIVEIRFQGSMQTLASFIYRLQNSNLLLKPSQLQIDSKGPGQQLLEGAIQITRILLS